MKILFLTDNFPPEVNAPASRTYEHCRRWVAAGADVTVITCAPNFPQGRVYPGYANRLRAAENINGIRTVRVWSYISANEGVFRRVLDFGSYAVSAFVAGLFESSDVIIATSPQFFTTFAGFALSIVKRKPWVFELRDLWPESIATVGALRHGWMYQVLEAIELFLYRRAARVIAVTPAFRENLIGRGIDRCKIDVVTNGADTLFGPRPLNHKLRSRLGIDDKFVIGYVGTHGMAHGLDFVLDAISLLQNEPLHFLFVGDGAEKPKLVAQAAALDLRNVQFCAPVPRGEVVDWLAACDALLVPLRRSETFKTVLPSKIFEAAAVARPILLGVDGQARDVVEAYGAGLYFEPENLTAFRSAVLRLANDGQLRQALIEGGRRLAAAYSRDALADGMLKILTTVTTNA